MTALNKRAPQSKQILIFGGSFNPPTLAHEAIVRACLELPQFDAVWLMLSGSRLDKAIGLSDERRMQLLQIVKQTTFADDPRLRVSDFELRLPRPTQMYRTMDALTKTYPGTEFWFAYGDDAFRSMKTWPHAQDFMSDLHTVVFTDRPVPEVENGRTLQLNIPLAYRNFSSTKAREAIATARDASTYVSAPVLAYIKHHGLYAGVLDRTSKQGR